MFCSCKTLLHACETYCVYRLTYEIAELQAQVASEAENVKSELLNVNTMQLLSVSGLISATRKCLVCSEVMAHSGRAERSARHTREWSAAGEWYLLMKTRFICG